MNDEAPVEAEPETEPTENPEPEPKAGSPWPKVFWLFMALIFSGLVVFLSFIWLGKQGIDKGAETIQEIFNPELVVNTFEEWCELEVTANEGNILEVSTARATEKFVRETNVEWFGKVMPLGRTVSEITVPATYRFHIDLNGDWFVQADGNRLMVIAPKLQPSLPVAFDSSGVRKKTKSGWARWDKKENLADLERGLTEKLNARAADEKTLSKVREESRVSVGKFVQRWLLDKEVWGGGKFQEIAIIFDDEEGSILNAPATIESELDGAIKP